MTRLILKILCIGGLLGFLLAGCAPQDDAAFARATMKQLIKGSYFARASIDWPVLKIMGKDIGLEYSRYKSDSEKTDYERSFITSFSNAYKKEGATASAFFDWQPVTLKNEEINPKVKVVGAYCHDKSILFFFFVSHEGGKRKLIEIRAMKIGEGTKAPATEGALNP
jgi:hypothetical protein